ncbi:MAG: helix-turn-helix domain-containing protein [Clostridiales bacterium]|nr:helix-turn-helix domain-containing protein [Clostridiales bacterium]HBM81175.1 hypothetical protein [Clostridiaceae bacterium]
MDKFIKSYKRNNKLKKSSLFIKFIISYIIILCIPLFLLGIWINKSLFRSLTNEVQQGVLTSLSQTMDLVDMRFSELKHLAEEVPQNPSILPLFLPDRTATMLPYKYYEIGREFDNYKATNSFIDEIFVYFPFSDIAVGSIGKLDSTMVFNNFFQYSDMSEQTFKSILKGSSGQTVRNMNYHKGNEEKSLTAYIYTYEFDNTEYKSSLMITMNDFSLTKIMEKALKPYKGNILMLDDKNNIITSISIGDANIAPETLNKLLSKVGRNSYVGNEHINGSDYLISYVKSLNTNWTCLTIMPSGQLMGKVSQLKTWSATIIVLCLILGVVLAYYFSDGNYNPIENIVKLLKNSNKEDSNITYKNEFDMINSLILDNLSKNRLLQEELNENIPIIRSEFLNRLIKGKFTDIKSINRLSEFSGINFCGNAFVVIVFSIDDYDEFIKKKFKVFQKLYKISALKTIEEMIKPLGKCYVLDLDNQAVAVINLLNDKMDSVYEMKSVGRKVIDYFNDNLGLSLTVGIGNTCHSVMDISKSYVEAKEASDYKIAKGKNSVITFNEINTHGNGIHYYSFHNEEVIIECLKAGNFIGISRVLETIMKNVSQNTISLREARCLYFEIINTAMKALSELRTEEYNRIMQGNVLPDLLKCETLDDVYKETVSFYRIICDAIKGSKHRKENEFKDKMVRYVAANFCNSNLSLSFLADKFSIPQSSLSKFFKNEIGDNFIDYINELRIKKAKEMLLKDEKNISDIAHECGYLDIHSFNRNFKKYTSITPSEFRETSNRKQRGDR